jgi:hypothetical protein
MNNNTSIARLLPLLESSLAMYISDAGIWSYPGAEDLKLALADLVADHKSIIERGGAILEERGAALPRHPYPIQFTATHDLDMRFLMPRVLAELRRQTAEIGAIVEAGGDSVGVELAREARNTTMSHADVIGQLLARAGAAVS